MTYPAKGAYDAALYAQEGGRRLAPTMIKAISITNFKCFKSTDLKFCRDINIVVGDNGSGKTTLLEAIFLTLGHSPRLAMNLRQRRGLDGSVSGDISAIEEAIWRELFFDWRQAAEIRLSGDGFENRSLRISRSSGGTKERLHLKTGEESATSGPVQFHYSNHSTGKKYTLTPEFVVAGDKIEFPSTPERIPDFFSFGSNQSPGSADLAARFSRLKINNQHYEFVEFMQTEYPQLSDIGVESLGGAPALCANIDGSSGKRLALNSISSGITRIAWFALGMFIRRNGVVMIDEIENGIYYKHYAGIWKGLVRLSKVTGTQLFISTHSAESLKALQSVASDVPDRLALWHIEKGASFAATVEQYSGRDMLAALKFDSEVR